MPSPPPVGTRSVQTQSSGQRLEWDLILPHRACAGQSPLWLGMHVQAALKYQPHALWANPWTFLPRTVPSLKSDLPPSSFKDHIKMKTLNSVFPSDTNSPGWFRCVYVRGLPWHMVGNHWMGGPLHLQIGGHPEVAETVGPTPSSGKESGGCLWRLRTSPWGSLNGMHAAQFKSGRNVKKSRGASGEWKP